MLAAILFLMVVFFNVVILKPTAKGIGDTQLTVPDVTFIYNGRIIYDNYFLKLDTSNIPPLIVMMRWDYLYPIIYTAFLFLMGQLLLKKSLYKKIFFFTVFAAFIFDYLENITQLYLLNALPTVHLTIGTLMGIFTSLKWLTVLFALISILVMLIKTIITKISTFKQ
jgi:hypothetical protein